MCKAAGIAIAARIERARVRTMATIFASDSSKRKGQKGRAWQR